MKKYYTSLYRAQCRERFYNPVNEQSGLIIALIYNGDMNIDDFLSCPDDYIDRSIFGNRLNSPPFRNALLKVIKDEFYYNVQIA